MLTLLLALALALFTLPALASQRIALVIGNGAYQHDKVLPNPRNDADGMAAVLRRLGFEVTQGKDLAKSAMERTVLEFGRKASGAEIALVYYAGHGLEVSGKNYLLPVDAKLPDELALRTEAVDLELILEAVAPARTRLLFLDACRNNPLANNMRIRTAGRSVGRGLGRVDAVSNTLIAFATAPGTVAADGEGRNSPFAAALMAHLEKPGLEVQQVMREVRRSVAQATGNKQVPWESSQLFDAVVLRPGAAAQFAGVVPEVAAALPVTSQEADAPAGNTQREPQTSQLAIALTVPSPVRPPDVGSSAETDIQFEWPSSGEVVVPFDGSRNRGISIGGNLGEPVVASADGRVVYVGGGLRGYGQMVIIKHNSSFLTAYAHNQKLLVSEDQWVKKGQRIAEMGSTDTDRVKLLFEVRRQGQAVDPMQYLPRR